MALELLSLFVLIRKFCRCIKIVFDSDSFFEYIKELFGYHWNVGNSSLARECGFSARDTRISVKISDFAGYFIEDLTFHIFSRKSENISASKCRYLIGFIGCFPHFHGFSKSCSYSRDFTLKIQSDGPLDMIHGSLVSFIL